jgi:hypothetical protein
MNVLALAVPIVGVLALIFIVILSMRRYARSAQERNQRTIASWDRVDDTELPMVYRAPVSGTLLFGATGNTSSQYTALQEMDLEEVQLDDANRQSECSPK